MPEPAVAAVVLAAGASRRLGEPKQLIKIEGESLLRRTARVAAEAGCAPVIVVIGFEAERMRSEMQGCDVQLAENPRWANGMGSSLRAGMAAVRGLEPLPSAVLLLVCDQPRLSSPHLRELLAGHASGLSPITASVYGGRTGVPAVFSQALFPELLAAEGDRGARTVIRRFEGPIQEIPWPDGAFDLDTPADRARLDRP